MDYIQNSTVLVLERLKEASLYCSYVIPFFHDTLCTLAPDEQISALKELLPPSLIIGDDFHPLFDKFSLYRAPLKIAFQTNASIKKTMFMKIVSHENRIIRGAL